jgi:DNA polymerase-3 subunit epsilon/ATP-dependent DNA helicase DinG
MERIYVAIDLEMTGLEVGEDEIIEVGAVKFQGDTVLETFSSLVKPRRSLPLKITRITGIRAADLVSAPRFGEVAPELVRFLKNYPLVGHSVERDLRMLQSHGLHLNQPVYDTFDLATLLLPRISSYKLGTLAEHLGISHADAHRALNDADMTRQVFWHLLEQIRALTFPDLTEVNRLMEMTDWAIRSLVAEMHQARTRQAFLVGPPDAAGSLLSPSPPPAPPGPGETLWDAGETGARDPQPAARPSRPSRPEGPRPLRPTGRTEPLDLDSITAFFAPGGAMSQLFGAYEQRLPQVEMARAVAQSFNHSIPLLVEAGTGTGKSMAYLLPSVLFAVQRGERVVVSTNTLNLQDQLFFKDIPDLLRMVQVWSHGTQSGGKGAQGISNPSPPFFTAALLKGRRNYLCLRRYKMMQRAEKLQPEDSRLLLKILFWLPGTTSGDGTELLLTERERTAWNRVNVPVDTCIGHRCPDFHDCFFFKARRLAEAAHVIVVNHALLLADLVSQSRVLPPYDHLIIDEAHNVEDVATDQFSFTLDQASLVQYLDGLYQTGGARNVGGLLSEIPLYFRGSTVKPDEVRQIEQVNRDIFPAIDQTREATAQFFTSLAVFVNQEMAGTEQEHVTEHLYDYRLRITPPLRQKPGWAGVEHAWDNLNLALTHIGDGLTHLEQLLLHLEQGDVPDYDELLMRVQAASRFATEVRVEAGHIISGDEHNIFWLSLDRARDALTLHAAPLSVAEMLQASLFAQKQTALLTSATLAVNDSLDFIKGRLGLTEAEDLKLESPFDYQQQAMVYIPNDVPEPNQRGYQQKVEEAMIQLGTASGGRMLALFTANSALRRTAAGIQDALEDQGVVVLGQGIDGSRRALLERFKECPGTVLLGTSSFWEGVDVIGEALSVLVIAKLPFSVPTDPIFAARSEQFAEPFLNYTIPLSILRFKQGFGRLIRSKDDRGIVVVLDKRLLTKRYGLQFLQSLPATNVREGPLKCLPQIATRFLGGREANGT